MKSLELRVASRENEKTIGARMQPLFDPMIPFLLRLVSLCLDLLQLQNLNLQLLWLLPVEIGPRPAPCGVS